MIKQFTKEEVGEILQRIYDSEINITIHWLWDGGIDWQIGDAQNGFRETNMPGISLSNDEWSKVEYSISALAYEVYRLFPESKFGQWYGSLSSR